MKAPWKNAALAAACLAVGALPIPAHAAGKPTPSKSNVAYGSHPNQVLDLYLPEGKGPFPVALFIHGGGWTSGDKVKKLHPAERDRLLKAGVAVVSTNYRFIADAKKEKIFPPVLAPLEDAKRALQFTRYHAGEWNLDPKRVVLFGSSAGAFSSLWLGLSPEMAQPDSPDPVARMSTRVRAIGAFIPQTSIDPREMREWVGPGLTYGNHAFGVKSFAEFLKRRDEFAQWYPKLSPSALVSKDDPPIYMAYPKGLDVANPDRSYYTHSPRFGLGFQKVAQGRGAVCYLQFPGHPAEGIKPDEIGFLIREVKK